MLKAFLWSTEIRRYAKVLHSLTLAVAFALQFAQAVFAQVELPDIVAPGAKPPQVDLLGQTPSYRLKPPNAGLRLGKIRDTLE